MKHILDVKNMGKTPQIPVLHLFHNQDGELYRANVREDKVYMKDEKIAEFSSKAVFTISDKLGRKTRKFKCIIYLDGKANACQIQTGKDMKDKLLKENAVAAAEQGITEPTINTTKLQEIPDNIETIFEPLTFKDRITVVKREIAKQLGKFKPMETWQFIVIIAMLSAAIALQFIV